MTDEKDDDLVACSMCGTPSMEAVCSSKCEDDYGDDLLKKYPGFMQIFTDSIPKETVRDLIDTLLAAQKRKDAEIIEKVMYKAGSGWQGKYDAIDAIINQP